MLKRFWLSYDFGIDGDYDGLYGWLDEIKAVECGEGTASFQIEIGAAKDVSGSVLRKIRQQPTKLRARDRLYLVWIGERGKVKGKFIHGKRRRAPWSGYAVEGAEETEDAS